MNKISKKKNSEGFTLVEIMIVVVIIAVLASLGIPHYLNSRSHAVNTTMEGNARIVKSAYAIGITNPLGNGAIDVDTWGEIMGLVQGGASGLQVASVPVVATLTAETATPAEVTTGTVKALATVMYAGNYPN